tara:strand:- start:3394 stop:3711 length:318 start_codon:yes stop_codon:yes gene_type:complete
MKKLFEYFTKLLFTIILPVSTILIIVLLNIRETPLALTLQILLAIALIISLLNALFFFNHMKTTHLIPKILVDFIPMFGVGISTDDDPIALIIVIPFIAITIELK